MEQFSIVFLQFGHSSHEVRELVGSLPGLHISARRLLENDELPEGASVFVNELEKLAIGRGDRLGALRERVMREAANKRYFALLSTAPKTTFPDTVGSDVVSDAKQLFPPISHKSPPGGEYYEYFRACISELGDRTLLALSESLWESQLAPTDALAELSKPDIEALRGAGLVATESNTIEWTFPGKFKELRKAVALVSAETVATNAAVPDTFSELWQLERLLRNLVRRALVDRMHDGWRESCLDAELGKAVVERAQRDSQPRATRLSDLRDPLEWLTTNELLDLRERHMLGGLGLEPHLWTRLRNQVLPIRNRVAHMRIVSDDDSRLVRTWRKLIEERIRRAAK